MKISKNFNDSEFACKRCCGVIKYSDIQLERLQKLHDYFSDKYKSITKFKKVIVNISSAFRCDKKHYNIYLKKWNKLTKEEQNIYKNINDFIPWSSQHLNAKATDIKVYIVFTDKTRIQIQPNEVATYCEKHFDGVGRYKTFTHADSRGEPARWNG